MGDVSVKYKGLIVIALAVLVGLFSAPNPTYAVRGGFYPFPGLRTFSTGIPPEEELIDSWGPTIQVTCDSFSIAMRSPIIDQTAADIGLVQWRVTGLYAADHTLLFAPADDGILGTWDYRVNDDDTNTSFEKTYTLPAPLPVGERVYGVLQHRYSRLDNANSDIYNNWSSGFKVGIDDFHDHYARVSDSDNFRQLYCGPAPASLPTLSLSNTSGITNVVEGDGTGPEIVFTASLSEASSETVIAYVQAEGRDPVIFEQIFDPVRQGTVEHNDFNLLDPNGQEAPRVTDNRLVYPHLNNDGYSPNNLGFDERPPIVAAVMFAPGETSKTFTVAVVGDDVPEAMNIIYVSTHYAVNASPADQEFSIIISDDDQAIITFPDFLVDECTINGSSQVFQAPWVLDRTMSVPAEIFYNVDENRSTAQNFEDFEIDLGFWFPGDPLPTLASVPAGELAGTIPMTIYNFNTFGDFFLSEPEEVFYLDPEMADFVFSDFSSSDPLIFSKPGFAQGDLKVTLAANGPPTTLATTATIAEGDNGETLVSIPVTMPGVAEWERFSGNAALTLDYEVFIGAGDTASASDVFIGTGSISIPEGALSGTIQIPVYGDVFAEGDETFSVRIIDQDGACLQNTVAQVTITDDDTFVTEPNTLTLAGAADIAPLDLTFGWTHQPAANVTATPGAPWYRLIINDGTEDVFSQWYNADNVCTGAACEIPFVDNYPYVLDDLPHTWTITSWKDSNQLTSAAGAFTVNIGAPAAPVISDVTINFGQPQATWAADSATEWYRLDIADTSETPAYGKWFNQADVCAAGTCTVDTMTVVQDGDYNAVVQAYGPANYFEGVPFAASDPFPFTVENGSTDPVGTITVLNGQYGEPDISVAQVGGVDWYRVIITADGAATPRFNKWFPIADICADNTCVVDTGIYLKGGDYTVSMQTYGPLGWNVGDANYTVDQAFSVINTPPVVPTDLTTLNAESGEPTLTWAGDANATWYQVWLGTTEGSQMRYSRWNAAADLGCLGGGTCTLNVPDTYLSNGDYSWYVRAYGPAGMTTWAAATFAVAAPQATAPTLISPTGTITDSSPNFVFVSVNGATWYQLIVANTGGEVLKKWYSVGQIGCSTNCTITPVDLSLTDGAYTWTMKAYTPAGVGPTSTATFTVTAAQAN